ncbi:glycosyltransferase [Parabacteroides faecis]|uniref:glycosyltransferase n=1 Tax=Parabacteroides faecis TaxID=1217282 RepID=UPI0021643DD6|nr:glycosyltransferase [Parabacteroides faecis]MCS2893455.1 glycosyltransferase [Parabacteroides faecis]UVQ47940.1 glycosyltransferase [Parabacteroides faecis]
MNLKISIIVPVYKVELYINQCIDSILAQSYKNFEVILVDDGSPDQCPYICDYYASKDSRIKVVHKMNGGLSSARNAGIDIASGDYIAFVDSDDYWDDTDAIKKCVDVCETQKPDVILYGFKKFYQSTGRNETIQMSLPSDLYGEKADLRQLLEYNVFVTSAWNKLVSSKLFKERSVRFVEKQLSEDIEYCAQLILNAHTFVAINEYFYVYRQQNASSISANVGVKNLSDIAGVLQKYATKGKVGKCPNSEALLNYIALQYVLWIAVSNRVAVSEQSAFFGDMKKFWWLIDCAWCPYVKKVKMFKYLGFNIVRKLLFFYYKKKRG